MFYMAISTNGGAEQPCFDLKSNPVIVGRDDRAEVQIDDIEASGLHFVVLPTGSSYSILDLNSRNGTWLNDKRVVQAPLNVNDRIRVGATIFVMRQKSRMGFESAMREIEKEQATTGKGFNTLFGELVKKAK